MRRLLFTFSLLVTVLTAVDAQQPDSITVEELGNRIAKSETAITTRLKTIKPIVEVYAQYVAPDATLGTVPTRDEYFLGQFDWTEKRGPSINRLTPEKA